LESAASGDPPSRFFKRGVVTLNTTVNQVDHIRKGCLSDPTADVVKMHRCNPRTKKTHTARGTSSLENEWLFIHHHILSTPSIGLTRAEKLLHNYFEASNDKKRVSRLGEEPEVTSRTESLQALHGLASRCGFDDKDLDFKLPSYPHSIDAVKENIGFEHQAPTEFATAVQDDAEDDDETPLEALDSFLSEVDFTEEDTSVDPTQFGVAADAGNELPDLNVQHHGMDDVFALDKDVNVDASCRRLLNTRAP